MHRYANCLCASERRFMKYQILNLQSKQKAVHCKPHTVSNSSVTASLACKSTFSFFKQCKLWTNSFEIRKENKRDLTIGRNELRANIALHQEWTEKETIVVIGSPNSIMYTNIQYILILVLAIAIKILDFNKCYNKW